MNLIMNGAEAMEGRTGLVQVATREVEVKEDNGRFWHPLTSPPPPGAYVVLEVKDNGKGMNEETISKIFDPFFTTKFTGRGLGLAAVLGIIHGHKGSLQLHSQPGQGTIFQLYFPAIAPLPTHTSGQPSDTTNQAKTLVLVIDDEAPVREAITDTLEIIDVQVITAANGLTGIELFTQRQHEIGLVLLDLSMPGLSGGETFVQLQQINHHVPIILSSGYSQDDLPSHLGNAGFLQKPYNLDQLIKTVRQYIP
jgi:CheY-like chemotaxis protein